MAMLEVENIHTYYGNIHALKGVSLTVDKGEIVTLIGGNGAGKTTTLRTITGIMKPLEGHVKLEGEDLTPFKAHGNRHGAGRTAYLRPTERSRKPRNGCLQPQQ